MCLRRHREHTLQAQESHMFVLLWVVGILWVLLHSTGWYLDPILYWRTLSTIVSGLCYLVL